MVEPASVKVRGQPVEIGALLFCRVLGMDLMKVVLAAEHLARHPYTPFY